MLASLTARRMPIQDARGRTPDRCPAPCGHAARAALAALALALVLCPTAGARHGGRDAVTNTAVATYTTDGGMTVVSSNTSSITVLPPRTPSTVEFLVYAPSSPDAEMILVSDCCYSATGDSAGAFVPSPPPETGGPNGGPIDTMGPIPLVPTTYYLHDETAFVRLTDRDQNTDPLMLESVLVSVRDGEEDVELLRMCEIGPDAGIFVGYILLTAAGPEHPLGDGRLTVGQGDRMGAFYVDQLDPTDRSDEEVPVDPRGHAVDSSTGDVLDGVGITLLCADTGEPASVLGDDGVSAFPASVVTGGEVVDSGGTTYQYHPGEFRFPIVEPGTYRLEISPPDGYTAPSIVPTEVLAQLHGNHDGPLVLLEPAMRGEPFVIEDRPGFRTDIPVDPIGRSIFLAKAAGRSLVGHGEFLRYELRVENTRPEVLSAVALTDHLPRGFRYQPGSARVGGADVGDPDVSADGRKLTFSLGELGADAVTVSYVVEVAVGAPFGKATNSAVATAGGTRSNVARADVGVTDDLFGGACVIVGRVAVRDPADPEIAAAPVAGARIYLEDGTSVLTDRRGMYHFDGVRPGAHVVALDLDSVPDEYEAVPSSPNSRFAGRRHSQFVDVQGGVTWRADFDLALTPRAAAGIPEAPSGETTGIVEPASAGPSHDGGLRDGALPAWVSPLPGHLPPIPSIKVAVIHAPGDSVTLLLDGRAVSRRNFEDTRRDGSGAAVSRWRGIDLVEGDNRLEAIVRDASGVITGRLDRIVHYSGPPVHARLIEERSLLTANGRDAPVLAVLLTDDGGHPAREGVIGSFSVEPPHEPLRERDPLATGPLSGSMRTRPSFSVGEDGIARIELEPTSEAREVVITLGLLNGEHEIRAWLGPEERDWILVGLAEGTIGHRTVEEHVEDGARAESDYYDHGRVAFFARGRIRGSWLLTLAYDTDGSATVAGDTPFQAIDPDAYYTLYGDAAQVRHDAASAEKLYVRIERDEFYFLFGDYVTGLTVTELSRYSRVLTGAKSEIHTDSLSLNLFASETATGFVKDEIPGDGTSGLYRLSRSSIVPNSERAAIETRDRFQSEVVLSSRWAARHVDYDIDYGEGTLFFKEPIPSQDQDLNPVLIVIEYESDDPSDRSWEYGGRGAVRFVDGALEVGATHVHEGRAGAEGDLYGVDATLDVGRHTELRAEFARTSTEDGGAGVESDAYLAELKHRGGSLSGRLYVREYGLGFGLGQGNASEAGTRRLGVDAAHRLSERFSVSAKAYSQLDLATDAERLLAEAALSYRALRYTLSAGFRDVADEIPGAPARRSTQATAGGSYRALGDRLRLRLDHEQSLGGNDANPGFPTRTTLGADYEIADPVTAFAEHEIAHGPDQAERSRVGLKTVPWTGAAVNTSFGSETVERSSRLYASLGLRQTLAVGDGWTFDAGLDHARAISRRDSALAGSAALPSSAVTDDFTAASIGVGRRDTAWSWTSRAEYRCGAHDDKWIVAAGFHGEPVDGLGLSGALRVLRTLPNEGSPATRGHVRLGLAYRPVGSRWTILDRLDVVEDDRATDPNAVGRRVVNNLSVNYFSGERIQIAGRYGAKHVAERIDGTRYEGLTDLAGLEIRYDLTVRWDVGLCGSVLHSWNSGQTDYSAGGSLGFHVFDDAWLSVGYNVAGFVDEDFSGVDYTARGPYVKLRLGLDRETIRDVADLLER